MTAQEAFNVLWIERKNKWSTDPLEQQAWQTLEAAVLTQQTTNK
jgi:hypothetical protein